MVAAVVVAGPTTTFKTSTCPLLSVTVLVKVLVRVSVPENMVVAVVIGLEGEMDADARLPDNEPVPKNVSAPVDVLGEIDGPSLAREDEKLELK